MIRNIFSSMWHNKLQVLLILILSTIAFVLALLTLTNSFAFNTQISMVEDMFSSPLDKTYRIDVSCTENFDTSGVAFAELKEFINQQGNTVCGAYDQTGAYFDELQGNQEYIALNQKAYAGTLYADNPSIAEVIFFDTEILNLMSGRLSQEDFQPVEQNGETYLPLYAGKDFKGVMSVGDVLTISRDNIRNGTKYIVKDFLPDDAKWFDDSDPITMPVTSLNHKFLAPFSKIDKTDSMTQQSTVGKIFIVSDNDIKDSVSKKALQLGIKLRVTSISDFIEQWKEDNNQILKLNFFLAAVVLICSAISMISTLCVTVLLKKKEYGIRIAFGTTKRQIILSLCFEILILNVIAGAIAFTYSYFKYANSLISSFQEIYIKTLCSTSLIGLIVLIIFLVAIVLLIPVVILARYNPAELVKEES